jgi:hypothetical protein
VGNILGIKEINGAPGEVRTPDLLLRRLLAPPRSSKNQWFSGGFGGCNKALSASIAHILHTLFKVVLLFGRSAPGRGYSPSPHGYESALHTLNRKVS